MNEYTQNIYIPNWKNSDTVIVSSPGAGGHFFSSLIQKYYYGITPNSIQNPNTNDWDSPDNSSVATVHLEGLFPYRKHPNRDFTKQNYYDILHALRDKKVIILYAGNDISIMDVLAKWKRCHRGAEHWSDNGWRKLHNRARANFVPEPEDIKHNKHYEFFITQCQQICSNVKVVSYHDLFVDLDLKVLELLGIEDSYDVVQDYIAFNQKILQNLDLTS